MTAPRPAAQADAPTDLPAANVVEALRRVMRDLPAIGRDGRADPKQGSYAYRGIEQVTKEAQRICARHGVVFVPQVLSHDVREIVVNDKPWTDTTLTVRYQVFGPGGIEDSIEIVTMGIGRDNSDKGANKAMTQAFKYALLQTFMISDSKDDGDGQSHEADTRPSGPPAAPKLAVDELTARVELLTPEQRTAFAEWKNDQGFPWPWTQPAVDAMHDYIEAMPF